jgi:hypothetical protein
MLLQGRLPNEKLLGRAAYPTHNPSAPATGFEQFPPAAIDHIRWIEITVQRQDPSQRSLEILRHHGLPPLSACG